VPSRMAVVSMSVRGPRLVSRVAGPVDQHGDVRSRPGKERSFDHERPSRRCSRSVASSRASAGRQRRTPLSPRPPCGVSRSCDNNEGCPSGQPARSPGRPAQLPAAPRQPTVTEATFPRADYPPGTAERIGAAIAVSGPPKMVEKGPGRRRCDGRVVRRSEPRAAVLGPASAAFPPGPLQQRGREPRVVRTRSTPTGSPPRHVSLPTRFPQRDTAPSEPAAWVSTASMVPGLAGHFGSRSASEFS